MPLTGRAQALWGRRRVPLVPERLQPRADRVGGQLPLHGLHGGLERGHAALQRVMHAPREHGDRHAQRHGHGPPGHGWRPLNGRRLLSSGRCISRHVRCCEFPVRRRCRRRRGRCVYPFFSSWPQAQLPRLRYMVYLQNKIIPLVILRWSAGNSRGIRPPTPVRTLYYANRFLGSRNRYLLLNYNISLLVLYRRVCVKFAAEEDRLWKRIIKNEK